ncbi:MAG: hypothetical protein WB729_05305 [Candidatus Sulfotelmatobacter sp.]
MKTVKSTARKMMFAGLLLLGSVFASSLWAQSGNPYGTVFAGDKSVWNSTATNSHAYIDAYAAIFTINSSADVCTAIQQAYTNLQSNTNYTGEGAVIDARGVVPTTIQTCSATSNLWNGSTTFKYYPATVLLPAGTIKTSYTWQIPSGTKIIGEGIGGQGQGTTIQATSGYGWMIQMGTGSGCTGVSIENLTLDGAEIASGVNGIVNQNCGDLSYVDHVWLYRILGTGLTVAPGAEHSGPYSDITFNTADATTPPGTTCVQVTASYTHGFRQITCSTNHLSGVPATAMTLCIPTTAFPCSALTNLSLEDVRIEGFDVGIQLGNGTSSVVLKNIDGDTNEVTNTNPVIVVNIPSCTGVVDIVVLGIGNQGTATTGGFNDTINEACTGTALTDTSVALYALGRPSLSAGGYSRFTTSSNTAGWLSGSGAPSSTAQSCQRGSFYSNTNPSSSSPAAFYVCTVNTSGQTLWSAPGLQ